MRKIILMMLMSLCSIMVVGAQDIYVYSIIGSAERQENGKWVPLQKRNPLNVKDIVRVANNSALSFIDRKAEKIYSISQTNGKSVGELIAAYKGKQSFASNFVSHASKSLFNGGSDRISHEAAGCTYRGDIVENDIAKSILLKHKGVALGSMDNAKTDYAISFDVLDRESKSVLDAVKVNGQAIFRIKNNSDVPLYVNILDVNEAGEKFVCLPIDDATTMSHLLIPANCTIDLAAHPVEFTEPKGVDNLILIATEVPYDLRQVKSYLDKNNSSSIENANYPIGVYCKPVVIK